MSIIKSSTNAKILLNQGDWHITASPTIPTHQGTYGDVVVLGDVDVAPLLYVVNIDLSRGDNIMNNAINIIDSQNGTEILVNRYVNWNMKARPAGSVCLAENMNLFNDIYFWDAITQAWVRVGPIFMDSVNLNNFTSVNLDVVEWLTFEESINDDIIVDRNIQSLQENVTINSFMDVDIETADFVMFTEECIPTHYIPEGGQ